MATYLFYLGEVDRARETSRLFSQYSEETYRRHKLVSEGLLHLFQAALFRGLSGRSEEASSLWAELVEVRRTVTDDQVLKTRRAHYFIYEAYGLAKMKRYSEIERPSRKGFEGMTAGRGIFQAPHRNSLEYGVASVLEGMARYASDPSPVERDALQSALRQYKNENVRYGRSGYSVIFDLQMSYPDIFAQILPGPDPGKD